MVDQVAQPGYRLGPGTHLDRDGRQPGLEVGEPVLPVPGEVEALRTAAGLAEDLDAGDAGRPDRGRWCVPRLQAPPRAGARSSGPGSAAGARWPSGGSPA